MKYKIGDMVFLKPKSKWDDGKYTNPLGTVGFIIGERNEGYEIEWSNATINGAYTDECLIPGTKLHKLLAGIETECYNEETEDEHV